MILEMATYPPAQARSAADSRIKAVLGPTNTGKTHLAIERLCAHSSGAIGFPLRLLARDVCGVALGQWPSVDGSGLSWALP